MNQNNNRKTQVLLALQQALLGEVTPRLRAVTVRFTETCIYFEAFIDGPIQDEDQDAMSFVETELMALFPSDHTISYAICRLDYPNLIPKERDWVYYRKETVVASKQE